MYGLQTKMLKFTIKMHPKEKLCSDGIRDKPGFKVSFMEPQMKLQFLTFFNIYHTYEINLKNMKSISKRVLNKIENKNYI